jgi:hypothetical protein
MAGVSIIGVMGPGVASDGDMAAAEELGRRVAGAADVDEAVRLIRARLPEP